MHCRKIPTAQQIYFNTDKNNAIINKIILNKIKVIAMAKKYNKLVRDKIPEIIIRSGKTCKTEILSDAEYIKMIDLKLDEELQEYHADKNIEELADLIEVIYAAANARGFSIEDLESVRKAKAIERGTFKEKILLKEVNDKEV